MKTIAPICFYIFLFCACSPAEDKVPYNGHLTGEIKYTGASNMSVDNVIITLTGISDNEEIISKRITNDGKYNLELPAGTYKMELVGNRCISNDLPYTIKIVANQETTKDINIEQLPYSLVLMRGKEELPENAIITLANADVLNVWNKYSSNTLTWNIRAYPQPSWINFEQAVGTIEGGGSTSIVYSIDKNKMPDYGENSAEIILTAQEDYEGRGFVITAIATKDGGEPEKAQLTGESTNSCPSKTVMLTAIASDATSYKWYKGNTLQLGANGNTFEVSSSGVYYAVGVNSRGEGAKSDGQTVTIKICSDLPDQASISGNATNDCARDGQRVTLTASATRATSYVWRKGSEVLSETGNRLVVEEMGTHTFYATGVNESGEGQTSGGKIVTISSCVPGNPSGLSAGIDITGSRLKLSWNYAASATRYRVQRCDNVSMIGCEGSGYYKETTSTPEAYFEESALFCGVNYFRVTSVNDFGENTYPATVSYSHTLSIAAPWPFTGDIDGFLQWSAPKLTGIHTKPTIYYDVYRRVGDREWKVIDTTTSTYYSDDTYSIWGESMHYKIRAYVSTRCGITENYSAVW